MADVTEGGCAWPGEGLVLAGRYRLVEFVAYGGAAALWRAHDPQLDRDVAVKVLFPHHHDDQASAVRFRQEAQAVAQVRHPNVVPIFDVVQDDGVSFLVMEYVPGPALSQFEGRALGNQMVAALGYQVALALGVTHDHDLVHRDVKRGNIVVDMTAGHSRLLDFGIAKSLQDDAGVTGPHSVVATTRYAAPEQVSGRPVGPWTDVYCLGLVLWELCTGRPAFHGPAEPAKALMRLRQAPPPLSEWSTTYPPNSKRSSDVPPASTHRADTRTAATWPRPCTSCAAHEPTRSPDDYLQPTPAPTNCPTHHDGTLALTRERGRRGPRRSRTC